MDKTLKKKWVKALRSGRYKQTEGVLREEQGNRANGKPIYGYCCLGVLCNVANYRGWIGDSLHDMGDGDITSVSTKKSGLTESQISKLISMNDEDQLSFKGIADWIEKKIIGV